MSDTWTIGELAEHAARALRAGGAQANGRVRDVPGERLIRWYTTIGLVDPPLTRRGRIAQYGRRHLLQLVAIKRLQAAGHSIAEIQTALAGATDRMLEDAAGITGPVTGAAAALEEAASLAGLADTPPPPDGRRTAGAGGSARGGGFEGGERGLADERADAGARRGDAAVRDRFWAERPGMDGAHRATSGSGTADGLRTKPEKRDERDEAARPLRAPAGDGSAGAPVVGVRLGDGVRLMLDVGRIPSEDDVQAVLAAAGPLLAVLEERELL
ncbi:helix-turn-helix domain-containing protein [Nonomuraea polychroma]|uniref:helix-turn-helix domain-containing protein n=1 Tax=Nonomuraea polychroma TaxID=46176 RepID=UPI003D8CDB5E